MCPTATDRRSRGPTRTAYARPMGSKQAQVRTSINRSAAEVWAAIADITRMGEWSPECTGGRWVGGATGPAVGARFEGDNEARALGRVVKRWTTTSEVTACEPGTVFEFVAEGMTTWRYACTEVAGANGPVTTLTETFTYEPKGFQGFIYEGLMRRSSMMRKGMERTLARVKDELESGAGLA